MRIDDLTRAQARALKNKIGPTVECLNRLGKRMSSRGFPDDNPVKLLVASALKALYELHAEMQCRSLDGKGREEKPPVDPLFTRTSAPRKHEKYRLGARIERRTNRDSATRSVPALG
jgi:hypothetical protein